MIKTFFDHQIFSEQLFGGISRYFAAVINKTQNTDGTSAELGVLYSNNYYLSTKQQKLNKFPFKALFKKEKRISKWNKSYCKYLLKQNDFDIFHPTYFNPYFLKELKKPFVLTVHDMTYEALPEYFPASDPLPHYKRLLVERADKIIAISETTKTDIIKYLNTDPRKIEVIHHGIDNATSTYQTIAHLPENYVLFVGARWGYKNFYLLARAFKELSLKYPDLKLVLAGGGQLSFGDSEILVRLAIVDKVIQISATDEELNTLYKKAICFIYPSLYEGFGLPILEAFKQGCPVLLSNSSCFKEIAGNAAKYFECNSLQSLIHETELLITNPELRSKMAIEGYGKLTEYSMEKCLNKTINLYKAMV